MKNINKISSKKNSKKSSNKPIKKTDSDDKIKWKDKPISSRNI